jgi:hypothetical protein
MEYGILVAADEKQEWLLPWWWENYCQENQLQVAFADFGMSEKAKLWCQKKGFLQAVDLKGLQVAAQTEIEENLAKDWEKTASPFWDVREAWFKKPFAFLNTPFSKTIWLDLDCEVLAPIDPLFSYLNQEIKLGIVQTGDVYNAGVIVFEKGASLINRWVESCLLENHRFLSDQDVLTHILKQGMDPFCLIPEIYNWQMHRGVPVGAKILHWSAKWGKEYIRQYGGLKRVLTK